MRLRSGEVPDTLFGFAPALMASGASSGCSPNPKLLSGFPSGNLYLSLGVQGSLVEPNKSETSSPNQVLQSLCNK